MEGEEDCPPLAVPIIGHEVEAESEPVGVTIITGYLGAGKSTLVNYILKEEHGKKIAVILNEFGDELGVERAMIREEDAVVEEWVELPNGCLCCTVKSNFVQALEQLISQRHRFDYILVETTGLANPGPVASLLWLDDELQSSVRLDSIVTVVDAKNLHLQLSEQRESGELPEAFLQIAFADVILLNKVDLIVEEHGDIEKSHLVESLKREIQNINSLAHIIFSVRCYVDLNLILDRKAYDAKHAAHLQSLMVETNSQISSHNHDSQVKTVCVVEQGSVAHDQEACRRSESIVRKELGRASPSLGRRVKTWLEEILWESKDNIEVYRCKGILNIVGSEEVHIVQAVRELYEIIPIRKWKVGENRLNKIVFIGRKLDLNVLSTSFKSCLTS